MAKTIKNLPEIIENESQYGSALKLRQKAIGQFSLLGPPDLCYLTKEFQRSLNLSYNKPSFWGFYHYNYGLCPSTPAAVPAYEDEKNWFSNGKWLISKACYCMFDIFTRTDIHLEIMLPGGMRFYGVTAQEEIIQINEKEWENAYISSVLRAMQPEKTPLIKIYKEFSKLEELENFFQLIIESLDNLDLPIEPHELLSVKGNKILNIICDYLNRKKRYQLSIKFFTFLSEYDFHYVVFLSEVFSSIGNSLDTIKLIAPLLQKNPHVFCLIYQEACSLLQLKRYDLAGTLARSLVQMIPESFEAWLLLIEIYFYSKKYEAALVTLNITPINIKTPFDNGFAFLQEKLIDPSIITNPKEKGTSDYFQFNIDITTPDFHHTKLNDEYKYIQQDYLEDNKKREEVFNQLPGSKFQGNELKLYSMLVKIEREISWEKLLMLRANLFLLDESSLNSLTNLKGKETLLSQSLKPTSAVLNQKQQSKIEDYDIYDEKDSYTTNEKSQSELKLFPGCDPQYKHHQKALEILNKKKPLDNNDVLNETDEEDSDKEHELPSFLKPEEDYKKAISGQILAKKEDSSIFINPPETLSMEERFIIPVKPIKINKNLENLLNKKLLSPKETEKEPNTHELSIRNINKTAEGVAFENSLDFSKKRLCSKLADGLFSALYDDLNALYEWSQEEYQKQVKFRKKKPNSNEEDEDEEENEGKEEEEEEYIEDLKISGKIWVLRGVLAQRLLRNRFAETAYRKAVEKGFSLFAWKQLLSIYLEIENFKAALVCIAELLDELENQGVENFIFLPKWMEEAILQIISKAGYKGLANLLSELNLDDPSINELIKDAVYWKVEGSASV